MNRHDTSSDRALIAFVYVTIFILVLLTLYPFWDLLVLSISSREEALNSGLRLYTLKPDFQAYKQVFNSPEVWSSFYNSIIRVVSGTATGVFLTALTAYPLSKKHCP
jgi:putative aldouronate transport system permease protein